MKLILGMLVGAAAGYAYGRKLEADANGVPLDMAFKYTFEPIGRVKGRIETERQKLLQAAGQGAPTTASWRR